MPNNITMPRLSDTMEVGTVVKWHVKPGQKVKSGAVIADIETDKATMEHQTFEDGTVGELVVKEGQSVPVGTVILKFEGGTGGGPEPKQAAGAAAQEARQPAAAAGDGRSAPAAQARSAEGGSATGGAPAQVIAPDDDVPADGGSGGRGEGRESGAPAESNGSHERVFASPLARKIAGEAGVDLKSIEGTGPGGRIVRKDVETFISTGAPAPAPAKSGAPVRTQPSHPAAAGIVPGSVFTHSMTPLERRTVTLSNMRTTIAKRLVESKSTIPHYQVTLTIRMDGLMALRQQLNDQLSSQGVKLSVNDFLVRACALAMHSHPFVNARWIPGKDGAAPAIEILPNVNIGVAIALPEEKGGGLVVASIRSADSKGLRQISAETRALADKARTKGLTIEEMADSTFTISNLGMFGVSHFTAIINPPNAAILAVGAAEKKPVVETGPDGADTLAIGHEMQMTMSSDHRIIDGAMAAAYLGTVKAMLEKPATLLV